MRVLIATDVLSGVWNFTLSLASRLCGEDCACMVAMIGSPTEEQIGSLPDGAEWESRDYRLEWMNDAADDVAATDRWLHELAERWQPDVVHLNQFAYAGEPFPAPTLLVAHSDVRSWWGEVKEREAPPEWAQYTDWVRRGLATAGVVVAPTAYQSGLLARHYGRAADVVVHNGIQPPTLPPDLRPASLRPLIVTAGRAWDEAKAVSVLDDALEVLGEDAPVAELAGPLEGPDGDVYVPHRLLPLGQITPAQMGRLYLNAGIYVGTSVYEPFGLSPLEAAHYGCALVLSDIGSFRDLWHGSAEFYSAGNPASLAGALRRVLEGGLADGLGARAQERARERFTATRMVERYRELYGVLVERWRTGGSHFAAGRRDGRIIRAAAASRPAAAEE